MAFGNTPWIRKPALGVGINWSHPLTSGLVSALLLNENGGRKLFDLCYPGNQVSTWTAAAWGVSKEMIGLDFDGSTSIIVGSPISISLAGLPFSIFVLHYPTTFTGTFFSLGTTGSNDLALHLRLNSTTQVLFGMFFDDLTVTVPTMAAGDKVAMLATMSGAKLQSIYHNGTFINSRTATDFYRGDKTWTLGRNGWTPSNFYDGIISCVFIWRRCLSPHEALQIYQQPFALIAPQVSLYRYAFQAVAAGAAPDFYRRRIG